MKLEIYDSEQKKLLYLKNVQAADVIRSFQRYASSGDFTLVVEHTDETALLVGIHNNMFTLTILLSDGGAYDCTSSERSEGAIDFVLGGQLIQWDRKFLVDRAIAEEMLKQFARNWIDILSDERWKLQA